MLGAGHKSVQMHQQYIHLQKSDVGKAFGTRRLPTFYHGKTKGMARDKTPVRLPAVTC